MDWQSLIQSGIIFIVLVWLIWGLKNQIKSMKKTMDVIEKRADEFEKIGEKYKKFSTDIEENANRLIKLSKKIFEKEKRLIEIEKSEAIGEQAKEIADLKFKQLGLELQLTITRIQGGFFAGSTFQDLLTILGSEGVEHLTAGSILSKTHGSKIRIGYDSTKSEDKKKEENDK